MELPKLPFDWVLLTDETIRTLREVPGVYINLRPDQDPNRSRPIPKYGASDSVCGEVRTFLRCISDVTRVAILFQGYSVETGVAVVEIPAIEVWDDDGCPRLDFCRPEGFNLVHNGQNFWGAFILAIAKVKPTASIFAASDRYSELFIDLVKVDAIP